MKTYITVWESDPYATGIYENCTARVDFRRDGKRARITYPGVKWQGNTGGYHEYVYYIDGGGQKVFLRVLRENQIRALKMGLPKSNIFVLNESFPL